MYNKLPHLPSPSPAYPPLPSPHPAYPHPAYPTLPSPPLTSPRLPYPHPLPRAGVDPECGEHRRYIDDLCADFERETRVLIERNIEEKLKSEISDHAYNEALLHTTFALTKCKMFHGRSNILSVSSSSV